MCGGRFLIGSQKFEKSDHILVVGNLQKKSVSIWTGRLKAEVMMTTIAGNVVGNMAFAKQLKYHLHLVKWNSVILKNVLIKKGF